MRIRQIVRKLGLCVLTCFAGTALGRPKSVFPWSRLEGEWIQTHSTRHVQSTHEIDWHCVRAVVSVDKPSIRHAPRGDDGHSGHVNITFFASLHNIAIEPIRTEWILSLNATEQNEWEFIAPLEISRNVGNHSKSGDGHHRQEAEVLSPLHAPITACRCILEQSFGGPSLPVLILMPDDNYSLTVLLPRTAVVHKSFSPELFMTFLQAFAKRFGYVGYDRELLSSYDVSRCAS